MENNKQHFENDLSVCHSYEVVKDIINNKGCDLYYCPRRYILCELGLNVITYMNFIYLCRAQQVVCQYYCPYICCVVKSRCHHIYVIYRMLMIIIACYYCEKRRCSFYIIACVNTTIKLNLINLRNKFKNFKSSLLRLSVLICP